MEESTRVPNKLEGFWYSKAEPHLPMPEVHVKPMKDQGPFVRALVALQETGNADAAVYRGCAGCRVCGKLNGNVTYTYKGWQWPSGYLHYITDHNVHPSPEFKRLVLSAEN